MPSTLAYWKIRGLAQPIRLMLAYTGEEYTHTYFECGEGPDYDKSCWFSVKHSLGLDFPNLPYYIDGDIKITQSNAIMRYLARKHGLLGDNEEQNVRVDILENQAMDFRNGFVRLCYNPRFEDFKDDYLKVLPTTLESFSKFLGDRKWFAGEKLTFPDFVMYELLDQHRLFHSKCLDDYENLKQFLQRFQALPSIEKYMKSDKFLAQPINNKMAKF